MAPRSASPRHSDHGFSLVELLVVIIIIAILAAIAVPLFLQQRGKAADTAAKSDIANLAQQVEAEIKAAYADRQLFSVRRWEIVIVTSETNGREQRTYVLRDRRTEAEAQAEDSMWSHPTGQRWGWKAPVELGPVSAGIQSYCGGDGSSSGQPILQVGLINGTTAQNWELWLEHPDGIEKRWVKDRDALPRPMEWFNAC